MDAFCSVAAANRIAGWSTTASTSASAPLCKMCWRAYLRARFPDVQAPIARRWAGIMAFTADGLPLVGRLPGIPHAAFAAGFNGHGLSLGAGAAERAVDLLLNNRHPGAISAERLR